MDFLDDLESFFTENSDMICDNSYSATENDEKWLCRNNGNKSFGTTYEGCSEGQFVNEALFLNTIKFNPEKIISEILVRSAQNKNAIICTNWCQMFVNIYIASMNMISPFLKLSRKLEENELLFLDSLLKNIGECGRINSHSFFCPNKCLISSNGVITSMGNEDSMCNPTLLANSILQWTESNMSENVHGLSIFSNKILDTYYCSVCMYQRVCSPESKLILASGKVHYLRPDMMKCSWKCVRCHSTSHSFLESKIISSPASNTIVQITSHGVTSKEMLMNDFKRSKMRDLKEALDGHFYIKYIVVWVAKRFTLLENINNCWIHNSSKSISTGITRSILFKEDSVRAVIWHHSKPYVTARNLFFKFSNRQPGCFKQQFPSSNQLANKSISIFDRLNGEIEPQNRVEINSIATSPRGSSVKDFSKKKSIDPELVSLIMDIESNKEFENIFNLN